MLHLYSILAVMLAVAPRAYAQEAAEQPPEPIEERAATDASVRRAIPRTGAPRVEASRNAADQRRAGPGGRRQRGDDPRTGRVAPRAARPAPTHVPPRRNWAADRHRTVIVRPPAVYNNYYSYPRRAYPYRYGYGAFGFGSSYYDPNRWYPGAYPYSPYPGSGYSGYYGRQFSSFDIGELRLQVSPRHAQVFVDGYYAGTVDDYDGAFQSLKLESGAYQIEIAAPGYETMTFDVRISPGQKITYRSDLLQRP